MNRIVNITFTRLAPLALLLWLSVGTLQAQTTSFSYQGRLTDGGNPATGVYDLQFRLFDALVGGNQVGTTLIRDDVTVSNGIFTVTLDFGAAAFPGTSRFLEISVRPGASTGAFTALSPLQPITPTPYAIRSLNATMADGLSVACINCVTSSQINSINGSQVTGNINGSQISGAIPAASVPDLGASYIKNGTTPQASSNFNISGNGLIGGNVGIGLTSPAFGLHVGDNKSARFELGVGKTLSLGGVGTFEVDAVNIVGGRFIVKDNGRVGIGTSNPNAFLDVLNNGTNVTAILGTSTNNNPGVDGFSREGAGVHGASSGTAGVEGIGSNIGVLGESTFGTGMVAMSSVGNLVEGHNNVGRKFHISNDGSYVSGSDFAEALPTRGDRAGYEPGDVLVVSTKAPGKVEKASRPYDARVAGVYSTRPGMLGADKQGTSRVDADDVPVAIVGIVPTKVSARNGPIRVGDLLTTSSTPGYAMRCANRVKCVGAVVGKALEPLAGGKGVIKVLVMLR